MRGIILAGGHGTRLYPATSLTSKQLLDVGGKPMVYYPLTHLVLAGIREILIISTPEQIGLFRQLLGEGNRWGMRFQYVVQPKPEGLAQAFILGEEFIQGEPVTLILGDNIFYGVSDYLEEIPGHKKGALIFAKHVRDPERFGVVEFDAQGNAISIEEKPRKPKSHYAVTGLYSYDHRVSELAKSLKPSRRGEIEITDLNRLYLERGELRAVPLRRGVGWYDTGTKEAIEQVRQLILLKEQTQEQLVGSPEEAAYRAGFIDYEQFVSLIRAMPQPNEYRMLLELVAKEEEGL
jgi:glucose-1-phosphate thymidylyltransferase